jgi:hyperosmotically inducible periplasmic protein
VVNNITVTPVVVQADDPLKASVNSAITKYEGVQADVKDGIITLRGTIPDKDKLQQLMMDLNALKPKKIDNQLVIKIK